MIETSAKIYVIVRYLTYGICAWGNCALTYQRKIVILRKRALRLNYFSKSKEHTITFFLKSNSLPLLSLFFRDCSYLLYDIYRQTAPVSILNQFVKVPLWSNSRYPIFYIFVHNRSFLAILANFSLLPTLELLFFGSLFP